LLKIQRPFKYFAKYAKVRYRLEGGFMALRVQKLAISALITPVILASSMFVFTTTHSTPAYARYTPAYCQDYARRVSRQYSRGGAVGGAVRGGVGGAAVGAVVGGRKGARRGAAIGAVTAGTARGVQRGVTYDALYRDCMRGSLYY
jgi:hypothetical protein